MKSRYHGRLKTWNAPRGFGFIVADQSGAELFVHISAFRHREVAPQVGEVLSFEVESDRDGRKQAVRVLRAGESAVPPRPACPRATGLRFMHRAAASLVMARAQAL